MNMWQSKQNYLASHWYVDKTVDTSLPYLFLLLR